MILIIFSIKFTLSIIDFYQYYKINVIHFVRYFMLYFLVYNVDVFVVDFKNSAQLSAIIFVQMTT